MFIQNSYLFTPLQNVLYLLEVNYGFLGAEELRDEGKCFFFARGAKRRGQKKKHLPKERSDEATKNP